VIVGMNQIQFIKERYTSHTDLILVSGSVQFLQRETFNAHANIMLGITDELYTGRMRSGRPTGIPGDFNPLSSWFVLRHSNFGGPTTAKVLLVQVNVCITPVTTILKRFLSHILNYGDKPTGVVKEANSTHYKGSDLLHMDAMNKEICYQTHFSYSGWGTRSISEDELGIAFGLPMSLRGLHIDRDVFPCPPVQILDGIFAGLWNVVGDEVPTEQANYLSSQQRIPVKNDRTWLPQLGEYLSNE
jgi:hypothetical protein